MRTNESGIRIMGGKPIFEEIAMVPDAPDNSPHGQSLMSRFEEAIGVALKGAANEANTLEQAKKRFRANPNRRVWCERRYTHAARFSVICSTVEEAEEFFSRDLDE